MFFCIHILTNLFGTSKADIIIALFKFSLGSLFVPLFALTVRSFIAKSYSSKINNNEHTMTSVSIAFRWAMLCTKSELRFRQYSFNHRIRNLRSIEVLRLTPYPLYQHAIVPFEFPLQVGWLFPLFTFNNVPLRGRYTFALSSAQFSAYYQPKHLPLRF